MNKAQNSGFERWLAGLATISPEQMWEKDYFADPHAAHVISKPGGDFDEFKKAWNVRFGRIRNIDDIKATGYYRLTAKAMRLYPGGMSLFKACTSGSQDMVVGVQVNPDGRKYPTEACPLPDSKGDLTLRYQDGVKFCCMNWHLVQGQFAISLHGSGSAVFQRACRWLEEGHRNRRLTIRSCVPFLTWVSAVGNEDVLGTANNALRHRSGASYAKARQLLRAVFVE